MRFPAALPTPASSTSSASTPPPQRRTLPQQGRRRALLQQGRHRRRGIWRGRGWGPSGGRHRTTNSRGGTQAPAGGGSGWSAPRLPGAQVESGARSPVTRAATKVCALWATSSVIHRTFTLLGLRAAADPGLDAQSAAEKDSHGFNQEDERVGHVPCNCKYCLKPSPLLVGRTKNHVQVDGNCKRIARPAVKNDDKEPAPPEEILEALREIPRLERADLLRAYSMLIRDDRLFRSLMALPKDMRKDWLLMETGNQ
ncbi:uncharacterized protein [Miscanthus floridulus]|uniref:uncharacterized protein isoform X1 n=1 Tax=Miscanthus floridulus TaxID=154761 RepID=UPI003457CE2C